MLKKLLGVILLTSLATGIEAGQDRKKAAAQRRSLSQSSLTSGSTNENRRFSSRTNMANQYAPLSDIPALEDDEIASMSSANGIPSVLDVDEPRPFVVTPENQGGAVPAISITTEPNNLNNPSASAATASPSPTPEDKGEPFKLVAGRGGRNRQSVAPAPGTPTPQVPSVNSNTVPTTSVPNGDEIKPSAGDTPSNQRPPSIKLTTLEKAFGNNTNLAILTTAVAVLCIGTYTIGRQRIKDLISPRKEKTEKNEQDELEEQYEEIMQLADLEKLLEETEADIA